MSNKQIGKLQAMLLAKQMTKQIDELLARKLASGGVKDRALKQRIKEDLVAKRKRRAEYVAMSS